MSGPVPMPKTAADAVPRPRPVPVPPPTSIGRLARTVFGAGEQLASGSLLVTAVERKAGVSWVAAGIAAQLASDGRSVLLADANMLRHLSHRADVVSLCTQVGKSSAWVLGGKPTGTAIAFGATAPTTSFHHLVALGEHFSCVVLDAPALSENDTALQVASLSTACLLVARGGVTERRRLEECGARLQGTGANFLGCVFNQYETPGGTAR